MSLLRFIAEVADEPLVLDPATPQLEHRENIWFLSATEEEQATLTAAEIATAFERCAEALLRRLAAESHHSPAVFYAWHDAQAGQLRCSTTSFPADQLPFGVRVVPTPLEDIAADFLRDPGYIPWSDLSPVEPDTPEDTREWTAEVWSTPVA